MPGSTTSPPDPPKAKVTETSARNGVFVRPVAVAGIFRPVEETPPALPEKRRFSTLVGDLRPCSSGDGAAAEDFARRRQSWDARQKEVPFGQSLLRKTPRNTGSSLSRIVKEEKASTNGSVAEEISCAVENRKVDVSKSNSVNTVPSSNSLNAIKENKSDVKALDAESKISQRSDSNLTEHNLRNKNIKDVDRKIISTAKSSTVVQSASTESSIQKDTSVTESVKQTKKVYGLRKREPKPDVASDGKTENVASRGISSLSAISKCDTKTENVPSKTPSTTSGLASKADNIAPKVSNATIAEIKTQNASKGIFLSNTSKSDTKGNNSAFKVNGSNSVSSCDVKTISITSTTISSNSVSSPDVKIENIESKVTSSNETISKSDVKSKLASSKGGSLNTASRLDTKSENAVSKGTSSINISKPDVTVSPLVPLNAISKTANIEVKEISSVSATTDVEATKPKAKIYGLSKSNVKKEPEAEKISEVREEPLKKPSASVDSSTVAPVKNISKPSESEISKSEPVKEPSRNSEPAKPEPNKSEKQQVNIKASSPPKEFRTVRRTSDVIAAKIQNIFSNIATNEKPSPVALKKSKVPDRSVQSVDNKASSASESKSKEQSLGSVQGGSEPIRAVDTQSTNLEKKDISKSGQKPLVESQSVKGGKSSDGNLIDSNQKSSFIRSSSESHKEDLNASKIEKSLMPGCNNAKKSPESSEVKTEQSVRKGDSKSEYSFNSSSKASVKKTSNAEGKMPIKKMDQNCSGGTVSSANQKTDRKSSDSTGSLSTAMEQSKESASLKETGVTNNNTLELQDEKNSKNMLSSQMKNISLTNASQNSEVNSRNVSQIRSSETNVLKANFLSHSTVTSSTVTQRSTSRSGTVSNQSEYCKVQSEMSKNLNGSIESTEITKVEVSKIIPSTVPGIVPTVNVLFRTKSPQGQSAVKEENRKKVVVETYSNSSPIASAVINQSNLTGKLKSDEERISASAADVEKEPVTAIECVQKASKVPAKHTIVNLQKEEVATVTLMPKAEAKVVDTKTSPAVDRLIGSEANNVSSAGKDSNLEVFTCKENGIFVPTGITPVTDKTATKISDNYKIADISVSSKIDKDITTENKRSEMKSSTLDSKMTVVDLGDWNKKFQRVEPEAPRAPLRRRALRDSLPPMLPLRSPSRYGSLKRIEDTPRYVPRSPSQSCLSPQRYSYTEMLSKVCSMGVLPYVEPGISKSCSSSSSQVSELWSELSEEQTTATHASEMLEAETTERMRLEKEVQELQNRCSQVQQRSDKMEMEMIEARVYRTPELNGDLSDDDLEGNSSLYKQKYERAVRDMEIMKRRIQQQHEEEMEQKTMLKKASDKRLAEALEDVEEERQVANQWKRKAQKLGSELQDIRLMLEEQMARNGELEKKQRRFDAELSAAQEEIKKERLLREKITREKEQALHEKYSLEQDVQSAKLDSDMLHEKIAQLNRELDELTLSSKGEEEVTQLKRAKQELERKTRDQEEELEELAAQVQMLEQAKLRLEMSLEKVRQEHRREASVREEEIEEIRASFSKKIKNLEAQLESEQDERHQLVKQKHELERRIYELTDQPPPQDPEIERRLRRDLKRTKALLRDAQSMLEHTREGQSGKTLIRQLKNQLEDSEFAKAAAVKARQAVEAELHECQLQLEEVTRAKNEAESRCLQLSREKSAIQTQLEEAEEEMAEVMKKYKSVVAQMSIDQKTIADQNQQIAELETERQMLKDQLSEVSHKFEHLAGQSEDTHKVHRLDSKVRDLESKLELEQTTRARLEHQIARLKEQNDRAREECDSLRNKELQAQEGVRRLQRQLRDLREDYAALQQKEADAYRKQHELEMALENSETDLQVTKNDLRLACQRIQDLQNALEDDLDSGTDVPDDSGSDSDSSFELSVLRNQSMTPVQRCDSVASNLSYGTLEGPHSRTSSFSHELSAFSRMMLRRTSMDFLG
ncbi:uncharacterized protein LOC118194387 isoform X2 [Stegodyphus dumicola]|uniref:uncharacterized protein LOC118194387 isoform X2 n=1 Tax=Stegodyphus dumicola TaxID=202533 RepID=UPI0015B07D74|nr:uncharacterized protein LOC118194387 isoform X2 [Stegodyphus dumicola]